MSDAWPSPNFALLNDWNDPDKERPATPGNLRNPDEMPPEWHENCDRHMHVGEIHQEAYNAHLILDLLGVPAPDGGGQDLDARVSVLAQQYAIVTDQLDRIEGWHSLETGEHGTVGLYCTECGHHWPCDTQRMAEGTYTDDDEPDAAPRAAAQQPDRDQLARALKKALSREVNPTSSAPLGRITYAVLAYLESLAAPTDTGTQP